MIKTPTRNTPFNRRTIILILFVLIGLYVGYTILGELAGADTAREVTIFAGVVLLAVLIFQNPVIGLAVICGTVLFQNLFSDLQLSDNLYTIMGVLTGISYIVSRRDKPLLQRMAHPAVFLAFGFVIWGTMTDPQAALAGTRSWLLTYLQLLVGMVLAAELLVPEKQRLFLFIFVAACIPSALLAFDEANIVAVRSRQLVRSAGFQGNQNALAFYLCVAIVFTMYLHSQNANRRQHWIYFVLYGVFTLGIIGTVSRAGFLMLVAALTIPPFILRWATPAPDNLSYDQRYQLRLMRERRFVILAVIGVTLLTLFIPDDYWDYLNNNLFAVREWDSGTQRRFQLADVAFQTWQNNIISGVGFGDFMYVAQARMGGSYTAHNMYLVTMAETGTIGFVLFIGMLLAAGYSFYQVARRRDGVYSVQAAMWLSVVVLVLLRGPTASTLHYDKLLWMLIGVGAAMAPRWLTVPTPKPTYVLPRKSRTLPPTPQATPLQNM
jgi:O-antigen ligase